MNVSSCPVDSFADTSEFNSMLHHVFSLVDIPINIFVIYLIVCKSSAKMKYIKWTLLNLQIFSTASDVIIGTLMVPYVAFPVIGYSPTGVLQWTGIESSFQAYLSLMVVSEVGAAVIIMFENRHHHISKRYNSGKNKYLRRFLIFLNFFVPLPPHIILFSLIPDQTTIKSYILKVIKCPSRDLAVLPIFVNSKSRTPSMIILTINITFYILQLLFFLYSSITILQSNIKNSSVSLRTRVMEKKFYYSVCAQSLIPFISIVIPAVYCGVSIYYSFYNQALNNIVVFVVSTHGLLGSIAIIVAYKEYRSAFSKLMLRKN